MRTTHLLLSTIAATALLTTGAAMAGDINGPVKPERAPAAQRNAPPAKIAPSMHAGERGAAETTGQGSADTLKPGTGGNAELNEHGTVGASSQKDEPSGKAGIKAEENGKAGIKADHNGNQENTKGAQSNPSSRSASEQNSTRSKSETSGQGAAAGAAKLTTQQRTKITTIIKKRKVEPAHVNFSIHVGVHVPSHVHYYPLPTEVVDVYPEWRGYDYILVSDQILVIDPDTRLVVAILET